MATGWLRGVVKEVGSGDSLVVVSSGASSHLAIPPTSGVRQEKRLILSGIMAPRLGRRDGSTADEPWAWSSREGLRRLLVGESVVFRIDDAIKDKNLEFATVFDSKNQNAAFVQLTNGHAKLKDKDSSFTKTELFQQLKEAEEKAKAKGKGLWSFKQGSENGGQNAPQKRSVLSVTTGSSGDATAARVLVSRSKPQGGARVRAQVRRMLMAPDSSSCDMRTGNQKLLTTLVL